MRLKNLIFWFLAFTSAVRAQSDSAHYMISMKVGAGGSFFSPLPVYADAGFSGGNSNGFIWGIGLQKKLNKYFSLGADLLYDFRGSGYRKVNDSIQVFIVFTQNGSPVDNSRPMYYQNHKIHSLDLPLFAKAGYFGKKFSAYFMAGINMSYVIKYRYEWNFWNAQGVQENEVFITDKTNPYTVGYVGAIGLKLKKLGLELRRSYFQRTDIVVGNETYSPSNSTWHLTMLYEFSL